MKILLLTQWFDPEPTFKGLLFAQALRDEGHEVEVLTGFPNYPGGKVYSGYKIKAYQKEVIDGITVHRSPLFPSHDGSAVKRVLNYVSFAAGTFLVGLIKTRKVDIIYSYHPPLTTTLSALLLAKCKRIPFVIDVQDLWPDTLSATRMLKNKRVLNVVSIFCDFVYKHAAKIVVLSHGFKSKISSRGVPEEKIEVIHNWCNEPALNNFSSSSIKLPQNGNPNLLFAGNLGFAQGLPAITSAAKLLSQEGVEMNIVLLGEGVAKLDAQQYVKKNDMRNVFFLPRVPMSEVGGLLNQADFLLVHLIQNELFEITIPSRTQANLAIGKPIIMGVAGDAADLVSKAKAGIMCKPDDPSSLAIAIKKATELSRVERDMMGSAGKNYYYKELSLKVGVRKFLDVFESVV